ncbi:MarR family winged helix-turn-helix transcriptional regulator [Fodinicola acaciae]|uniref:MarR family winged helix-turn-helix transcriptional regulator n=1 Tax=Fodinicola acaciae TaxID=2681555 RepID=UPI0013CF8F02|nr:MarR family transcriptional regulator [Fodinicola acaciae]
MDFPAALCALHREVAVLYGATARRFDLTVQQAELLRQLDLESLSFGELARRLGCDKSNMTGMVDRLVRRGLLVRQTDPDDRRIVKPVLTDEGDQLVVRIRAEFAAVVGQRCADLPATEKKQMAELAAVVSAALSRQDNEQL